MGGRYVRLAEIALPRFSLNCEQEHVDIFESDDMAWSRGKCYVTFTGPGGEGQAVPVVGS
jgi:hypothetical protein